MSEKKKTSRDFLRCEICDVYVPNQASLDAHQKGKRHIQNEQKARSREQEAEKSIFISGLADLKVAELSLVDYFSKYGPVAKIIVDKNRGVFAILEFSEKESAIKALEEKQHLVEGREVIVKPRELKGLVAVAKLGHVEQSHVVHNRMSPAIWNTILEAKDTESQFHVLHSKLSLTEDDTHIRDLVCQLLKASLEEVFHSCEIQPFGSSINGLGINGCDLDLNFDYRSVNYQAAMQFLLQNDATSHESKTRALSKKQTLSVVAAIIKMCVPDCHQVKAILSARRPVVKFHHKASEMCCDISTENELAVRNTEFLKHLSDKLPFFAPLVQAVRLWMKHWNLAGSTRAASALLNNYAVTLMVLYYLYDCGEIHTLDEMRAKDTEAQPCIIDNWDCSFSEGNPGKVNNMRLSELFAGFFHFYGKFDFANKVLCLKTGKQENVADCKAQSESMEHTGSSWQAFRFGALNICDPFELDHNVAGNVSQKHMTTFTKCVRNAALASDMKIYLKKPGTAGSKEPWGILNLFIDHHAKRSLAPSPNNSLNEKPNFRIAIKTKSNQQAKEDVMPLIVTILTDVFLVRILEAGVTPSQEMQDSKENGTVQLQKFSKNSEDIEKPVLEQSRKRHLEETPVAEKRARLSLSSPEALNIKCKASLFDKGEEVELPIKFTGEVQYRVWEGRRKARRHLVQPGVGDILNLERQISKLLLSEYDCSHDPCSSNESTLSSRPDLRTFFQFHATIFEESEGTLTLGLEFKSSENNTTTRNLEQDFKNLFHHLEISLPNMVAKCLRTA